MKEIMVLDRQKKRYKDITDKNDGLARLNTEIVA